METLSSVCLLATHLMGILNESFNLCFLIWTARQIIFSIFVGVLDERQHNCYNIVAVASDLRQSARVPEVWQVVLEERGEARGCSAALPLAPSPAASPGTGLQSCAVPGCVRRGQNTRDPSAFHGDPGTAAVEAATAPPGVFIHS